MIDLQIFEFMTLAPSRPKEEEKRGEGRREEGEREGEGEGEGEGRGGEERRGGEGRGEERRGESVASGGLYAVKLLDQLEHGCPKSETGDRLELVRYDREKNIYFSQELPGPALPFSLVT